MLVRDLVLLRECFRDEECRFLSLMVMKTKKMKLKRGKENKRNTTNPNTIQELSRTIQAITNDLNMYMWGSSSSSSSPSSSPHTLQAKAPLRHQTVERFDKAANGGIGELDKGRDRKGGKRKKIDCRKFERDLRDVSFRSSLLAGWLALV